MGALAREPDATARRLEEWLTVVAGHADVQVEDIRIPAATGWSNETIMFDARWREGSGDDEVVVHRELVARIAPTEYAVFPEDTFTAQYDVMRALAVHADVPVAAVHWFEPSLEWFGSPFWIMARVSGDIATDSPPYASSGWLFEASPADQERAWWSGVEAMAAVHRADLADLGPLPVRGGSGAISGQLDHCEQFLTWAEDGTPHPLARHALDRLRRTAPAAPAQGPSLTWGDSRLSNLIYQDFEVVAVLDWEMMSIGDPLLDVWWWLFADDALTHGSGCRRLPGFPSGEATGRRWSELTGRSADALGYYELLAGLRFTIIMLRMGKLLHDIGLVPTEFAQDNLISRALQQRLDREPSTPG